MLKSLRLIGQYTILMSRTFRKPQKWSIFRRRTIQEMDTIGLQTIAIVMILSLFMGAAVVIQMMNNLENPLLQRYIIGYAGRQSIILEFSSTVLSLILAGKIGSNIASEIGTMRITEQIDGLEIMGVNSANYLILPKIAAAMFFFPLLSATSMVCGLLGGSITIFLADLLPQHEYFYGMRFDFEPFTVFYSLIKSFIFGIVITSVSSYFGYYAKGNSLEVGRSSTKAVVMSSVWVLIFNIILTQLLLIR